MSEIFQHLTFAQPWWFLGLLTLIPLAFLWRKKGSTSAITYSSLSILVSLGQKPNRRPGLFSLISLMIAIALCFIALARPQWINEYKQRKASGIDIILAIDISYSMEIKDFELNSSIVERITAAKATTESFIEQRPNDRMGIVAFSGRPYLTSPITLEHEWLIEQLRDLRPGLVQEQGTAIGSAIAAAATRLHERESKSKVIVLVTDGSNNSGRISPIEAAKHAATLGIKVYAIAIGTEEGRLGNGFQPYPQQEFDTETLQKISQITGGEYFRVRDTAKLRDTFQSIDALEKTDVKQHISITREEWFPYVAGAALIFTILALTIQSLNPPPAP